MSLRTMFVDMNAYFASVEQQENPALRGRPVAVAAVMVDSTCCIAVSYEAKRMGVKGGTPVGEAKRLCPGLRVVEARPDLYVAYHDKIRKAIESCLAIGKRESIDEFWCPLSDGEREAAAAVALARRVKRAIRSGVGPVVKCSIGLAPNKFLAKVASDMRKPDGLTVITSADLPHKLYPLQLDDLPGIGPRMLKRLHRRQVFTVERLCALPKGELVKTWGGVVGEYWWHWLRGEQTFDRPARKRTIGHSHVLPPEHRTVDGAKAVLIKLIHRSALRLRKEGYWARRMEVYISYTYREEGWCGEVALGLCQDTLTMIQAFNQLWQFRPPQPRPTQVAITLFGLTADAYAPLPLFPTEQHRVQLARVMDVVNERHGHNTVFFAGMNDAMEDAPTRIAFNRVPDIDDPDYGRSVGRPRLKVDASYGPPPARPAAKSQPSDADAWWNR